MSLTVTRPGLRPPYSGSDRVSDTLAFPSDMPRGGVPPEDSCVSDDMVETSKASRRPAGVPGHLDNGTLVTWQDNQVPSDFSFDAADEIVRRFHERGGQPAISYGIVRDGSLVHAAGFGACSLGGPPPDERTVFRIASMTKSFTASAILLLRDA